MPFLQEPEITACFDVSIAVFVTEGPMLQKEFLTNHALFQRNGIEVILLLEAPSMEQYFSAVMDAYPLINWKIIQKKHFNGPMDLRQSLREVSRLALHKYILLIGPEAQLVSDAVYQLRRVMHYYPGTFAFGSLSLTKNNTSFNGACLMAEKIAIEAALPLCAPVWDWAELFDEMRLRLGYVNVKQMYVPEVVVYSEAAVSGDGQKEKAPANVPGPAMNANDLMGDHVYQVIFNWQVQRSTVLEDQVYAEFEYYWLRDRSDLEKKHAIICLMQIRNEQLYIPDVLTHLDRYCDGIILLDDGSTDGSFEAAMSDKLLLKVKKKHKGYFDDLENRNQLLKLSYLFQSDWLFFMDADERFDERYADLRSLVHLRNIDTIRFQLIHLWNEADVYRIDVPTAKNGILSRYRMFRNKGFMQIVADKELHFAAVPFANNCMNAAILIKHYGLMEDEVRRRKYERYSLQDEGGKKQGYGYDYLVETTCFTGKVDELQLPYMSI